MSFLQPFLLAALPLIALPIIIHLINQRRYQTIRWAAMMFLLAANRMSRGYARLRQWLILAFRTLVIAALVFAVARPLASGWLGLAAGGRPDTTLILLDRSPSMQQKAVGSTSSKSEAGIQQLVSTLSTLGSKRWVVIDSVSCKPIELESPAALLNSASASGASSSADVPAMLQAAYDYLKANRAGQTDIWICSDQRGNDWNAASGRWPSLREQFGEFKEGVRLHLLADTRPAPSDFSVRVTGIRRESTSDGANLLVSLHLAREQGDDTKVTIPLQFEIDGARSELSVDMTGAQYDLKDHPIALAADQKRGWGHVSIPADLNPADNDFYFVYDEPPPRQTIIVADDPQAVHAQQLAAEITGDPKLEGKSDVVNSADMASVEWEKVALVLWQAPLPEADAAERIRSFVARGGVVIFFPPANPDSTEFNGASWQSWEEAPEEISVETWRGDEDLLAHTQSGAALPVGEWHMRRFCHLNGEFTQLATLHGGSPLLVRTPTDHGGIYFCCTTPAPGDSSLAIDGVVFYVAIQRALAMGTSVLGTTRQVAAGELPLEGGEPWRQVAGPPHALSLEYPAQAGVYGEGDQMLAVNRSDAEDLAPVLADDRTKELFHGLNFDRVDAGSAGTSSLVHEIWRMFLCTMIAAMLFEASLCLPKRRAAGASTW